MIYCPAKYLPLSLRMFQELFPVGIFCIRAVGDWRLAGEADSVPVIEMSCEEAVKRNSGRFR
jgi:hypothetical protein